MTDDEAKSDLSAGHVPGAPDAHEAILEALWRRVLEAWDDDKPHHALLDYALRAQKLPEVAGLYRALKDSDPEKAARAQKKLDGIVVAATQMMMAMKSPPDRFKLPRGMTASLVAVTFLLLAWLAYAIFHRR